MRCFPTGATARSDAAPTSSLATPPQPFRRDYQLYPGKPCVDEEAADCALHPGPYRALGRPVAPAPAIPQETRTIIRTPGGRGADGRDQSSADGSGGSGAHRLPNAPATGSGSPSSSTRVPSRHRIHTFRPYGPLQ